MSESEPDLAAVLERVPLFERCHPADLRVVARHCELRTVPAGTTLIQAGDNGDEMFIVLAGAAIRGDAHRSPRMHGPGSYFGELAILDPAPRSLIVMATEVTTVALLSRSAFLLVLDAVPGVAPALLASLARRVRQADLRSTRRDE